MQTNGASQSLSIGRYYFRSRSVPSLGGFCGTITGGALALGCADTHEFEALLANSRIENSEFLVRDVRGGIRLLI